jgi:hypothetical protein
MSRLSLILIAICLCATTSIAQYSQSAGDLLGSGISIRGGLGHLAIKDGYISEEKYSGTVSSFSLFWLQGETNSASRLGFDYSGSSAIRNNNVSAQVAQAELNLDFLRSVGRFSLLNRDVFAYVGPSADWFLYYRQQRIANGGNASFSAYSFAMFLSLNVNSTLVMPLSSGFSAETSARLSLLAMGGRLADLNGTNVSFFKLVSVLSGLRGHTELLLRYDLSDIFLLKAGYRFEICQSSTWSYLLSASDNLVLIFTVRM